MTRKYKRYQLLMIDDAPHKECGKCGELKPVTEFYKNKATSLGICNDCKECQRIKSSSWRENNPDKRKSTQAEWLIKNRDRVKKQQKKWRDKNKSKTKFYTIKYAYGLSREGYVSLLNAQHNRCGICGIEFGEEQHNKPHIDHCHTTNKIRGLLCSNCNVALGLFGDSTGNLGRAIEYLLLGGVPW